MPDISNDPFVQLQQARKAHRRAAHIYANTKKSSDNYDGAVERLEHAAMTFAMAAMVFGSKMNAAATDPEPE